MSMLHPSYREVMDKVNEASTDGEPIVNSRYAIVLGAAKRARQLVAADKTVVDGVQKKALSIAVDEIMKDTVHILSEESENYEEYESDENGAV